MSSSDCSRTVREHRQAALLAHAVMACRAQRKRGPMTTDGKHDGGQDA